MNRFVLFSLTALVWALTVLPAYGADGNVNSGDPISPIGDGSLPDCVDISCPPYKTDTSYICPGDTVYDTLAFYFNNMSDPGLNLNIDIGLGWLTVEKADSLYGYYSFVPPAEGEYTTIFMLSGLQNDHTLIKVKYVVFFNDPPVISCPGPQVFQACGPDTFCFDVTADDPDDDSLIFNVLSGNATISGRTVCVTDDHTGSFDVVIEVVDECGNADTCEAPVTIVENHVPYVTAADDFSMSLCVPETVCFTATADDADFDIATVTVNHGTYNPASDRVCFLADTAGIYRLIVTATDSCGASDSDTTLVTVDLNHPPVVDLGSNQNVTLCSATPICIDAAVIDENLKMAYANIGVYYPQTGQVCFEPDAAGMYTIIVQATDDCGAIASDTILITVSINNGPLVVLADDGTLFLCEPTEVCLGAAVSDDNLSDVSANIGSYNGATDQICFTPDTAGTYTIVVQATDSCEATDSDTALITVYFNAAPIVELAGDSVVSLCEPVSICLGASVTDDNLETVSSNIGTYDSASGQLCFTPDTAGLYTIILTATDSCVLSDSDTAFVTVDLNQRPQVEVESLVEPYLCGSTEFCIDVTVNDDGPTTVQTNLGYYNPETHQVCIVADTSGVYTVAVSATDSCGSSDSDTGFVTVSVNQVPLVNLEDNVTAEWCGETKVCLDAAVTDDNLMSVSSNLGDYSGELGAICFAADTPGVYTVILTAVDSCEVVAADTALVTVQPNHLPTVDLGDDRNMYLCWPGPVQIPASISDDNLMSISSTGGSYDEFTGRVEVLVLTPGVYTVIVTATDSCGSIGADTVRITVEINSLPIVSLEADFAVQLCENQEICVDVSISDDNLKSVTSNLGTYNPLAHQVCFLPDTAGAYTIIVQATDSCNMLVADTALVTVDVNEVPQVIMEDDFDVSGCGQTEICVDVGIIDDNLHTVTSSIGTYNRLARQVCFTAQATGEFTVIVQATDSCGATDIDTVVVTVTGSPTAFVILGNDSSVSQCTPSEICVPVAVSAAYKAIATNLGSYDAAAHQVCFVPDTSGVYQLIVQVTDSCDFVAKDTATIAVDLNSPPVATGMRDTTIYLCYPQEICLPVNVSDPEGDLDTVYVNRGTYRDGKVCFTPYSQGSYEVIVTAIDGCGLIATDTAVVTVKTDQAISIQCPRDTTVFTCQLVDTFCFPLSGVPEGAQVSVTGINTWYNPATRTICFWSQCSATNRITVNVSTPCNTYTCQFTVTVRCNSSPFVALPRDTTIASCQLSTICLPVGITDAERNLREIIVDGGSFIPMTSRVCFFPDTIGRYVIRVTAVDSCGATGWDQIVVTVAGNWPPDITFQPSDSVFSQCVPQEICLPVQVTDPEGRPVSVWSSIGTYNSETGEVCFTPDSAGRYRVIVVAKDECGFADSAITYVRVIQNEFVTISCPIDPADVFVCQPGPFCWPLEIRGTNVAVRTSFGSWANGQLCFNVDTSGFYVIDVIADGECNSDTCRAMFDIQIDPAVEIICPRDTTVLLCGPDTICLPFTTSPNVTSVTANAPAFISGQQVCIPALTTGARTIRLIAGSSCSADTCTFTVTPRFNVAPVVDTGKDSTLVLCQLSQVCVPFTATDADGNITQITTSLGAVVGSTVCFTPPSYGQHRIIVTAIDQCGASDADTVFVTVNAGAVAQIVCPSGTQSITICGLDTFCVAAPISPADAKVTVSPIGFYNATTGQVCIPVSQTGTINVAIIAESPCGSDTCQFPLVVTLAQPPVITCPTQVDTSLCLVQPVTFCYPVAVTGTVTQVKVTPFGSYASGKVCFTVSQPGNYTMTVTATGPCGADTCITTVKIDADQPPALVVPAYQVVERCLDDTELVCLDGIYAADNESAVSLAMTCGVGTFNAVRADSGEVCFLPDSFGVYQFCFTASDGCHTVADTFEVEIREKVDCDVCIWMSIGVSECVPVGWQVDVPLNIATDVRLGGLDLLVSYDPSLIFLDALITGGPLDEWEYFTWSRDPDNSRVRFLGLADQPVPFGHPPESALRPEGQVITMRFAIENDQNLNGRHLPVSFAWADCGDNTFSDPTGYELYTDLRIFSPETLLLWDELDDEQFPESERPCNYALGCLGAPDTCFGGGLPGKPTPTRCIKFTNGAVCVISSDSVDDRGDINLNGVAYEIADAVLFTNYFIYGLTVFKINLAGQIVATDVNADGLTLSVGDLVYLIRIITGDANPIHRVTPYAEELIVSNRLEGDAVTISTEAVSTIGAACLVYEIDGDMQVDQPKLAADAQGMDLLYGVENRELRVLIYDIGTSSIAAGRKDILEIPYHGSGQLRLKRAEIVDYHGQPYVLAGMQSTLPTGFALNQNYPNPFNPSTTISFTLPQTVDWTLQVYNITGSLVREFAGRSEAGVVSVEWDGSDAHGMSAASGVYLYRLKAGGFSDSRKMVLLK